MSDFNREVSNDRFFFAETVQQLPKIPDIDIQGIFLKAIAGCAELALGWAAANPGTALLFACLLCLARWLNKEQPQRRSKKYRGL